MAATAGSKLTLPVDSPPESGSRTTGIVALGAPTGGAVKTIKVDDSSRILSGHFALLESSDGSIREIHCVESIPSTSAIRLSFPLRAGFDDRFLVIQGAPVETAISRGVEAPSGDCPMSPVYGWAKVLLLGTGLSAPVIGASTGFESAGPVAASPEVPSTRRGRRHSGNW